MQTKRKNSLDVRKMTYLAIFTAIVFVLQILAIPVGGFFESSALPVAVIVIGTAILGIGAGAWLGFIFGVAVMILPGTQAYLTFGNNGVYSAFCTVGVVFLKGIACGAVAGLIYKLVERYNRYVAIIAAGICAVTVNTGIFILGSVLFFEASFAVMMTTVVFISYPIELAVSVLLAPVALRVINIKKPSPKK